MKIFIPVIGLTLLCAWTTKQTKDISKAEWLIGTWENKNQRGSIYESWTKESDWNYSGLSYSLNDGDTTVFETISIVKEGDAIYYIPTVKNQNDANPVRFLAKNVTSEELIFENPSHDFPQVITYNRINADSLVAVISGVINGQQRARRFPMKRVKP